MKNNREEKEIESGERRKGGEEDGYPGQISNMSGKYSDDVVKKENDSQETTGSDHVLEESKSNPDPLQYKSVFSQYDNND